MHSGRIRIVSAAFILLTFLIVCGPAAAIETVTVSIAPDDSEIITTDLKRIRLAEPADVRFKVTTPYIAQIFGDELTVPRNRMRLIMIATARRVLGAMTGAQATSPEAPPVIVREIDRALSDMGVAVEQHNLRYVFVPGYTP